MNLLTRPTKGIPRDRGNITNLGAQTADGTTNTTDPCLVQDTYPFLQCANQSYEALLGGELAVGSIG